VIIHREFEQKSAVWLQARAGIVTASEADNLVTPLFKPRTGHTVESYLALKLAERWLGGPLMGFSSFETEQGEIIEAEARAWLDLELDKEIEEVGLCVTDDGRAGASPDGIIGGNEGLELKSPQPVNHIKWLLAGGVPPEYLAQIHFSLFVTGFNSWRFLSYRRGFPKLLLTVERDEKIQAVIKAALQDFLERFDVAWKRLCEINGGEPKRIAPAPPVEPPLSLWPRI
jgi:hypothetical protein